MRSPVRPFQRFILSVPEDKIYRKSPVASAPCTPHSSPSRSCKHSPVAKSHILGPFSSMQELEVSRSLSSSLILREENAPVCPLILRSSSPLSRSQRRHEDQYPKFVLRTAHKPLPTRRDQQMADFIFVTIEDFYAFRALGIPDLQGTIYLADKTQIALRRKNHTGYASGSTR